MSAGRPGFLRRLYRGEANVNFIGPRRKWYIASAVLLSPPSVPRSTIPPCFVQEKACTKKKKLPLLPTT